MLFIMALSFHQNAYLLGFAGNIIKSYHNIPDNSTIYQHYNKNASDIFLILFSKKMTSF